MDGFTHTRTPYQFHFKPLSFHLYIVLKTTNTPRFWHVHLERVRKTRRSNKHTTTTLPHSDVYLKYFIIVIIIIYLLFRFRLLVIIVVIGAVALCLVAVVVGVCPLIVVEIIVNYIVNREKNMNHEVMLWTESVWEFRCFSLLQCGRDSAERHEFKWCRQ